MTEKNGILYCSDMAVHDAWQLHCIEGSNMDQLSLVRYIAGNILESNRSDCKKRPSESNSNHSVFSRYDEVNHILVYQERQEDVARKKVQFR